MSTDLQQARPLGRPCVTCSHADRAEIEERMVSGDSLLSISRTYEIDRASLDRHRARHVAWSPELAAAAGLTPETVTTRLIDIAMSLEDDRKAAWEAGNTAEHRKASEAARRAWGTVGAVSGDRAPAMAAKVEDQQVQLRAMAALLRRHPQVLDAFTRELDAQDAPEVAEQVRTQFQKTKEIES